MRTVLYDLPIGCKGFVIHDPETLEPTTVLNSRYTYEMNKKTYDHENKHIERNDLFSNEDVDSIENKRRK